MDKLTIALAIHVGAIDLMNGGNGFSEYNALMTSTALMKDSLKALGLELPVTYDEDGHIIPDTYVPWTPDETVEESLEQLKKAEPTPTGFAAERGYHEPHAAPGGLWTSEPDKLEIIKEDDAPLSAFVASEPYFEPEAPKVLYAPDATEGMKDLAKSVLEASKEAFDRIGMAEDAQDEAANARRAAADGLLPDGEPALNEDDGFIDPR